MPAVDKEGWRVEGGGWKTRGCGGEERGQATVGFLRRRAARAVNLSRKHTLHSALHLHNTQQGQSLLEPCWNHVHVHACAARGWGTRRRHDASSGRTGVFLGVVVSNELHVVFKRSKCLGLHAGGWAGPVKNAERRGIKQRRVASTANASGITAESRRLVTTECVLQKKHAM